MRELADAGRIRRLKEELHIKVELAVPDDFIPGPVGWEDRSLFRRVLRADRALTLPLPGDRSPGLQAACRGSLRSDAVSGTGKPACLASSAADVDDHRMVAEPRGEISGSDSTHLARIHVDRIRAETVAFRRGERDLGSRR